MQKCKNFNVCLDVKNDSWGYFGVLIYQAARAGLCHVINKKINKSFCNIWKKKSLTLTFQLKTRGNLKEMHFYFDTIIKCYN